MSQISDETVLSITNNDTYFLKHVWPKLKLSVEIVQADVQKSMVAALYCAYACGGNAIKKEAEALVMEYIDKAYDKGFTEGYTKAGLEVYGITSSRCFEGWTKSNNN